MPKEFIHQILGPFCRLEILRQQNPSDVEVAIEPEELEGLDEASIQALYNQRVAEERARNAREVRTPFLRVSAWCCSPLVFLSLVHTVDLL